MNVWKAIRPINTTTHGPRVTVLTRLLATVPNLPNAQHAAILPGDLVAHCAARYKGGRLTRQLLIRGATGDSWVSQRAAFEWARQRDTLEEITSAGRDFLAWFREFVGPATVEELDGTRGDAPAFQKFVRSLEAVEKFTNQEKTR